MNNTIAQSLVITGAMIFLFLGIFHGLLTLQDLRNPRTFTPLDPNLRKAMQESHMAIDPHANLWKAWLGFNFSHSLGLSTFGGILLAIGISYFGIFAKMFLVQGCILLIASIYLLLSLLFWFSKPSIGAGLALTCLAIAVGLIAVG
jgi:hypothetical protein